MEIGSSKIILPRQIVYIGCKHVIIPTVLAELFCIEETKIEWAYAVTKQPKTIMPDQSIKEAVNKSGKKGDKKSMAHRQWQSIIKGLLTLAKWALIKQFLIDSVNAEARQDITPINAPLTLIWPLTRTIIPIKTNCCYNLMKWIILGA